MLGEIGKAALSRAHSTTLRAQGALPIRRQVLECGTQFRFGPERDFAFSTIFFELFTWRMRRTMMNTGEHNR